MLSLTSPTKTIFHKIPAGPKLLALLLLTLGLFWVKDWQWQLVALGGVIFLYCLGGRTFARQGFAMMRPIWIFVALIMFWHSITNDIQNGAVISLRLVACVGFANLITMTTQLQAMIDLICKLLRPFRAIGLNPSALSLAIAMVIRFTPVLTELALRLSEAWRARSVRRAKWRLVMPLAVLALDDADHVAEALRARGGVPRNDRK